MQRSKIIITILINLIHTVFKVLTCKTFGGDIMKEISHTVELTSEEIANLWTQYMNDSL